MNLKSKQSASFFFASMFLQLPVLIKLTLLQVQRRKALFFLFSLLAFYLLGEWFCTGTFGENVTKGVSVGTYFTLSSLWVTVFLVMMTSDLLRQDLDSQVHTLWLSRPLDPLVYLAGKGITLLILVVFFLVGAFAIHSAFAIEVPWDFLLYQGTMFLSYGFLVVFALLITLTANQTISVLLSFGLLLGSAILDFIVYNGVVDGSAELAENQKLFVKIAYWILPQLGTVYYHSGRLLDGKVEDPLSYGPYSFLQVGVWILLLKATLIGATRRKEI
ncbi:ABC-2 family transporter protein [Leptospira inadai serovar Lyme str. 10]|uniref:ABC-2 family transporter protein n=2 Tax=Leptospira inadai serovar Lyme TaxID=293084 RepID=V6HRB8_9LEPT|nr:ABC-2 family transporter protein [Leptospira inadai]EQA35054.1 ABC-2 family transporter protein [Leptospira inadai serovar Lyme str. 10]PNV73691.1 ABC transporter permease [Leptospira inadai serovar Lyme]